MYRLRKNKVTASNNLHDPHQRFTITEVVELLRRIEELKNLSVSVVESIDGYPMFMVGDYLYEFREDNAAQVN